MRNNRDIDRGFRNVETNALNIPPSFVWDGIESSLQKKTNRKGLWLIIVLAAATGTLLVLGNAINKKSAISSSSNSAKSESTVLVSETKTAENHTTSEHSIVEQPTPSSNPTSTSSQFELAENSTLTSSPTPPITEEPKEDIAPAPVMDLNSLLDAKYLESFASTASLTENSIGLPVFLLTPDDIDTEAPEANDIEKDDPCPGMGRKKKIYWFGEFGGIVGHHSKNIELNSELSALRQETEKEWYTWGGFAGFGVNLKPYLYLSANLNWMQQKDRFKFEKDAVTRFIVDLDPNTGLPVNSYYQTGSWLSEGEVRYTTFDAAINLGYKFAMNPRSRNTWIIGIEPGLIYNFSLKSSGKIMMDGNTISRVENENVYKPKLGFGVQTQLLIEKPIGKTMTFQIKPYYKQYFGTWNTSSYSETLRINNYGIRVGFRKYF